MLVLAAAALELGVLLSTPAAPPNWEGSGASNWIRDTFLLRALIMLLEYAKLS